MLGLGFNYLNYGNFNPSALFTAGEAGVFYDSSDLSTMFQDSAGTTPAVVDQPVGLILDKSGRGNNASQATAGSRPILRQDASSNYYLEFDGVDDWLRSTFAITQTWDRISAIRQIGWTTSDRIYGGATALAGLLYQTGASPQLAIHDGVALGSTGIALGTNGIITERHAGTGSRIAINTNTYFTGDTGTTLPGGITLGANHDNTLAGNFRFYGALMIGRALTDAEITSARNYFAGRAGVTL